MPYRIDNSSNDAPYQGIHIFNENEHVLTFWEDDAPVRDFNQMQNIRADALIGILNKLTEIEALACIQAFKHASFPKPHERIKL